MRSSTFIQWKNPSSWVSRWNYQNLQNGKTYMRNKNIKAIFLFEVTLITTGIICSAERSVQQVVQQADEQTKFGRI